MRSFILWRNRVWITWPLLKDEASTICMHFSLRTWEKRVVPDIVQKNGILWLKRWLERVPKIIGCSSEMISNALKWKAKPESRGWKKTKDFPLERIEEEPRVAKTEPMIGSRVIKDRLKIPLSAVTTRRRLCGANLSARSPAPCPPVSQRTRQPA